MDFTRELVLFIGLFYYNSNYDIEMCGSGNKNERLNFLCYIFYYINIMDTYSEKKRIYEFKDGKVFYSI